MMADLDRLDEGLVRPMVVDTLNGRELETSQFLIDIFTTEGSMALPNILSPEYECTMKELPF